MQLLTNVAVVVGIVLLIYELNQSRDLTRAQVVDAAYGAAISRNLALLGESPERAIATSVFRPEEITESEAIVLSQFYTSLMVSWLRVKDEHGLGFFGGSFEEVVASEAHFLNTVPGRIWWASTKEFTDPEIVKVVDEALQSLPQEVQRKLLEQMVGEKANDS